MGEKKFLQMEMSQKLPVDGFKWKKIVENLLEVDIRYSKRFHNLHSDSPFLPEIMKTKKCSKLIYNLHDKKKLYCSHKSFKTSIKS